MIVPPSELLRQAHFARYFNTWQRDEDSIVFVPLAEICRQKGHLELAKQICEQGLNYHPDSVSGRLTLARIYCDLKQPELAQPILEKILQDQPGHPEAEKLLGSPARREEGSLWETCTMAQILIEQGERKAALDILNKILFRNPAEQRALELKERLCRRS